MKALLQKDRPWIVFLLVAGTIALTAALCERAGFYVFVAGEERLEAPFHTAWIAGLVLGVVAACFDEGLGTREFLRQRPVSFARLFGSRLCGCGIVLLGWLLLAPIGAWLLFAIFGEGFLFTRMSAVVQAGLALVPAASACAIGLAAGLLPTTWWRRLLAAAAWFLATFAVVGQLASLHGGSPRTWFVVLHLASAGIFVGIAAAVARHSADADRSWPASLRALAIGPLALALALLTAAFVREPQVQTLRLLYQAYPELERRGDEVVLVHQVPGYTTRLVVDREHRPTGEELPSTGSGVSWILPDVHVQQFEIDAPRWPAWGREAGSWLAGSVVLAADGAAWLRGLRRGVQATGKGPELASFGPDSSVIELGGSIVVLDARSRDLWRLDAALGHFVPLPLPADDVLERLDSAWLSRDEHAALRHLVLPDENGSYLSVDFVRGERAGYVLRDGALVAVPGLREQGRSVVAAEPEAAPDDPISFDHGVPASARGPGLRHRFTPRTMMERLWAAGAMSWSLLGPPAVQAVAHTMPASSRPACWFDPLVQGGRRPWLVLAGIVVAALCAWRVRARLRTFAAPRATLAFWVVTTLLLGPIAAVLSLVFERPRAYAQRALPGPFPAPRIVTVSRLEEPVA